MRSISYGHLYLWPHDGNSDPTIKRWTLEKSNLNSKQHWLGTGFYIMDQGLFAYVNSNPEKKNKETTVYRSMPGSLFFMGEVVIVLRQPGLDYAVGSNEVQWGHWAHDWRRDTRPPMAGSHRSSSSGSTCFPVQVWTCPLTILKKKCPNFV